MRSSGIAGNLALGATAALVGFALWMIFIWVPTELNQGALQRALYFHVPIAWVAMVAIVLVAVASVLYLVTKREFWDRLASSTAEVGVVAAGLILITGAIWARPVWGVWWTGEAKLTTTLILFFIYVAYLMFRAYFPPGAQRQRLAAIIAIIGAIDAPIIYFASWLWQEAHPAGVVAPGPGGDGSLAPQIGITLLVSVIAFTTLFTYVVALRHRQKTDEDSLTYLRRVYEPAAVEAGEPQAAAS